MDLYYKGRPRLRWEDCVKRDVKKAGYWKKKTGDRGGWKTLAGEMVKKRKRETDKTIQKVNVHEIRQYRIK